MVFACIEYFSTMTYEYLFLPISGLTAIATYFLTKEVWSSGAGLFAACFIAVVPGYISRSVAGSYDNEGIAIFALMFTYYLWVSVQQLLSLLNTNCHHLYNTQHSFRVNIVCDNVRKLIENANLKRHIF